MEINLNRKKVQELIDRGEDVVKLPLVTVAALHGILKAQMENWREKVEAGDELAAAAIPHMQTHLDVLEKAMPECYLVYMESLLTLTGGDKQTARELALNLLNPNQNEAPKYDA